MNKAKNAVKKIVADIEDRCGIGDEWSGLDDEIKEEIKNTWISIIEKEFSKGV